MEDKLNKIRILLIKVLYIVFFLSGAFVHISEYSINPNLLIIFSSIFIFIIVIFVKNKDFKLFFFTNTLHYIFFLFFALLSALILNSIENLLDIFKFLIFYIILVTIPYNLRKEINFFDYLNLFLISSIIILFINHINEPLNENFRIAYQGIFSNPNNLGTYLSTVFGVLILIIFHRISYNSLNNKKFVIIFLYAIYIFYLLVETNSRTSLLSSLSILFLVLLFILGKKLISFSNEDFTISNLKYIVIFLGMLLVTSIFSPIFTDILESFSYKIESAGGNILSTRDEIWRWTIQNSGLFGNGPDYTANVFGLTTHNSFLAIIDQFGWFSGVFYILFWINNFIKLLIKVIRSIDVRIYVQFALIVQFILLSITEVQTHTIPMYLALLSTVMFTESFEHSNIGRIGVD